MILIQCSNVSSRQNLIHTHKEHNMHQDDRDRLKNQASVNRRRSSLNDRRSQNYTFHAQKLDQDIWVTCPISGMMQRLEGVCLPITFSQQHPIATPENSIICIKSLNNTNRWDKAESQLLAGMALSLLKAKRKIGLMGDSSASEHNMILQSAGFDALKELCQIIESRWNSEQTWLRMPSLSLDLTAYSEPVKSITSVITGYSRLIRKALSLEELPNADRQMIVKSYKDNVEKITPKDKGKIQIHSITAISEQTIKSQDKSIKSLFREIEFDIEDIVLRARAKKIITDFTFYSNNFKAQLSISLMAASIKMPQNKQAIIKQICFILQNAEAASLEDMIGPMDSEVPTKKKDFESATERGRRLGYLK